MSTKQMLRAALNESLLTMWFSDDRFLSGYLVGMDDFHWLVAHVKNRRVHVSLVHKTIPHVEISPVFALESKDPDHVHEVRKISSSFLAHCRKQLSRPAASDNTTEETTQR
jgi:hypothetical protein